MTLTRLVVPAGLVAVTSAIVLGLPVSWRPGLRRRPLPSR